MNVFLDSSALAKRYLDERGSEKVEELCAKSRHIFVSIICLPEIFSALNRHQREGRISPDQYGMIKQAIVKEFEDFETCPLTSEVILLSIKFLENFPLRTMDALHLACCVDCSMEIFVSSDKRQLAAAKHLKLTPVIV
jgi:predicted nucleic acid-binding protein